MSVMQRHRVFVQQTILPPYRLAFMRQLSRAPTLSATIAYGREHPRSALRSLQSPEGLSVLSLKNVFVVADSFMTVQLGALTAFDVSRFDTLICTFDPRIVTNALLVMKAKRHDVPVILWGHGIRPRGRFKPIYRRAAELADAVILYSGKGKRALKALGVDERKMFVAWNSIDTHVIGDLRARTPLAARDGIVYLGRLVPDKKVALLIAGFARALPRLGAGAHLYIVGAGPSRDEAVALARRLGLDGRVTFVAETYREEEISTWMNRCWLSVSPGYVGLSVIHAFAYGVPMLAGDAEPHSPEVEALVPGKNAALFRSDDPDALAEALIALRADPAALQALGDHALRTSELFSVRAMAQSFERAVAFAHGEGPPDPGEDALPLVAAAPQRASR
jgi:glycosyltransferase involved in cell wall biosynthesis